MVFVLGELRQIFGVFVVKIERGLRTDNIHTQCGVMQERDQCQFADLDRGGAGEHDADGAGRNVQEVNMRREHFREDVEIFRLFGQDHIPHIFQRQTGHIGQVEIEFALVPGKRTAPLDKFQKFIVVPVPFAMIVRGVDTFQPHTPVKVQPVERVIVHHDLNGFFPDLEPIAFQTHLDPEKAGAEEGFHAGLPFHHPAGTGGTVFFKFRRLGMVFLDGEIGDRRDAVFVAVFKDGIHLFHLVCRVRGIIRIAPEDAVGKEVAVVVQTQHTDFVLLACFEIGSGGPAFFKGFVAAEKSARQIQGQDVLLDKRQRQTVGECVRSLFDDVPGAGGIQRRKDRFITPRIAGLADRALRQTGEGISQIFPGAQIVAHTHFQRFQTVLHKGDGEGQITGAVRRQVAAALAVNQINPPAGVLQFHRPGRLRTGADCHPVHVIPHAQCTDPDVSQIHIFGQFDLDRMACGAVRMEEDRVFDGGRRERFAVLIVKFRAVFQFYKTIRNFFADKGICFPEGGLKVVILPPSAPDPRAERRGLCLKQEIGVGTVLDIGAGQFAAFCGIVFPADKFVFDHGNAVFLHLDGKRC